MEEESAGWSIRRPTAPEAGRETEHQTSSKSNDTAYSDGDGSQPSICLPPPPWTVPTTESRAGQISLLHGNSGALAAQAMAKLWRDPSLPMEAEVRHPWRRQSYPLSKANSDDGINVLITHDADEYFDDADLNGFWRRRTLEFA